MGWLVGLAGMVLTGLVCYWMGVRAERGKHARWAAIQEVQQEERRQSGGVTLKRLRIQR